MTRTNSILLGILLAVLIAVGGKTYFVLDHFDKAGLEVAGEVHHELDGNNQSSFMHITKKTVGETRDLVGHTSTLVGLENTLAVDQNTKVLAFISAGTAFLNDTNQSVNTVLLPKVGGSIDATTQVARDASKAIGHLDSGLTPILQSAETSTHNLEVLTADPNIAGSFKRMYFTFDQLGQTAANGNAMSLDVREKVHTVLHPKPLTFWRKAGEFGISHLSQISQIKLGLF